MYHCFPRRNLPDTPRMFCQARSRLLYTDFAQSSRLQLECPICSRCRSLITLTSPGAFFSTQISRSSLKTRKNPSSKYPQPKRKTLSRNPGHKRTSSPMSELFAGMNQRHPGILPVSKSTEQRERRPGPRSRKPAGNTPNDSKNTDMKALRSQRALSQVSYAHRAKVKNKISDIRGFEDFSLLPEVLDSLYSEALGEMPSVSPTPIQRLAIPNISKIQSLADSISVKGTYSFSSYLLAAETGSGKTLAYLLPTINDMKQRELGQNSANFFKNFISSAGITEEQPKGPYELDSPSATGYGEERKSIPARPRVVVLLPTAELVDQVGALFKVFSHTVKFRVALLSARYSATIIRNRLFGAGGVDVLVSTPHILGNIAESDPNILSCVTHLIIDEADSLFDRSFAPLTTTIMDRSAPSLEKLILSSATIPRNLDNYLTKRFPGMIRLATPNLHAIPRRVQLNVVDIDRIPYHGNRDLACADAIREIGRESPGDQIPTEKSGGSPYIPVKYIIVFVNERETTSHVANYLTSKGINASALDRDATESRKSSSLSAFMGVERNTGEVSSARIVTTKETMSHQRGQNVLSSVRVLVMTDLGSRGIDTLAVRHVILYDVPHTTIDFIHRLGRTGRMGRRGRGIILVGKGDRKDIVREVRHGMYKGQALV